MKKFNIHFHRLNHVQLCIPKHEEPRAREFYCGIIGLKEIEKPEYMKKNGGFWLEIADIEMHIGTEDIINQSKRHPAFEVSKINTVKKKLIEKGVRIKEYRSLPLFNRFSFFDPFNNRIELLEAKTDEELSFLGKEVTVQIDRPLGSKHPKFDLQYPLNYGFVPGIAGPDGQPIDVYVVGKQHAINQFTGIVKAVIVRYNDNKNKLVCTHPEFEIDENMIKTETHFQEQYFETEIRLAESY